MAYNHQQVPFWDFIRSFDQNGAGVDHPAEVFNPFAAPPPPGAHPHPPPPHPFAAGFPFGGPGFWGQGHPHHGGPFAWGGRGGRRGRHGGHHHEEDEEYTEGEAGEGPRRRHGRHGHGGHRRDENDHTPPGSRSASPEDGEHTETEAGEGGPAGPQRHGRRHGHHGPRGFGHRGRGGWGEGFGRGGWGGRHGHRGGPPRGAFDLSALFESLSAHPLAQTFRDFAAQAAQRSGEALVPEDTDAENSFIPPVDVFSTEKAFVLHVALPGAKKEDVGVNWDAEKGLLNLAGVVYRQGDEEFLKTLSKSERKVGVFDRSVKLPPGNEEKEEIDGDAITAKLEDGVLVVTVPKVEKEWTEVKKVDII